MSTLMPVFCFNFNFILISYSGTLFFIAQVYLGMSSKFSWNFILMFDVKEIQMSWPGPIHSIKARAQPKRLKPCKVPTVWYLLSEYWKIWSETDQIRYKIIISMILIWSKIIIQVSDLDLILDHFFGWSDLKWSEIFRS